MAVHFRLPALMREALAEFSSTFILLVSGLSDNLILRKYKEILHAIQHNDIYNKEKQSRVNYLHE